MTCALGSGWSSFDDIYIICRSIDYCPVPTVKREREKVVENGGGKETYTNRACEWIRYTNRTYIIMIYILARKK